MSREFIIPEKIFTGINSIHALQDIISVYGKRALIVTGKSAIRAGNVKKLEEILEANHMDCIIYDEITGEPTNEMIEKGLQIFNEEFCDFLIGIGGGSPLDAMKAIAAMATNKGKISDYMGKEITTPVPPMIAIPTTAGTGSEATQFTIITDTDTDVKMLLKGKVLMPDVAVVDFDLSVTAPKKITASTGLDALTHSIEAYTSKKAQLLTDTMAVSAVKRIFQYLPAAYQNGEDKTAREQMSIAALEAGIAFNNSSVTLVHGMSRPIGALFHVPHGISNAMLLPVCLKYALPGTYDRFGALGKAIGAASPDAADKDAANLFLQKVGELCSICEIPTLEEYGIEKEKFFAQIPKMAADAIASGSPANTRREITQTDVEELYADLWES